MNKINMARGEAGARADATEDRAVEAARRYIEQGLKVVPVEPGTKSPKIAEWPRLAAEGAFAPSDFAGMNVGVVLGHVSGDLVDIDLDSSAALSLAPYFLPSTLTFGRASKPGSHWLYRAPGVRSSMNFFPVSASDDGRPRRELIEIRSTNASSDVCGHQSVFPGSVHESGELVAWDERGEHDEPQTVEAGELVWSVARLTVASAILDGWTEESGRHEKSKGLAGGLLKLGWTADEVRHCLEAVRSVAGDTPEQERDFGHDVETTIRAFENGAEVTGIGALAKNGFLTPPVAQAIERHATTPEQRLRQAKLAMTGAGSGARARLLAEARAVDGIGGAADIVASFGKAEAPPALTPANDAPADAWAILGAPVDFMTEAEPLAYLVEGLPFAPGGKVNALAGPPKGGKSPFASLLAISVGTGRAFLGRKILQPGPVLYLDAETGRLAHIRYRRLCRALDVDPAVVPLTFLDVDTLFSVDYLTALEAYLRANPKRLVVIDTYGAMLEGGIDYNSPDFALYLKQLGRMSRRLDVVILVLIHEKKSGGNRSTGLEMISGSFSAAGAMQGVVSLRPEAEGNDAAIVVSCSRAPEDDFRPFRMRWLDVAAPGATSPGQQLATGGKRWGLAAELVEGEPVPAVAGGPKASRNEEAVRCVFELLTGGPATMRKIRSAVTAKQVSIGREALAALVNDLVERGTLYTSVQGTSGRDVVLYGLRERPATVG